MDHLDQGSATGAGQPERPDHAPAASGARAGLRRGAACYGYLALGLLLVVASPGLGIWRAELAAPALGLASTALLARSALRGGPPNWGWAWLSIGTLLWSTGDLTWALVDPGFPSVADWLYLAGYAAFGCGILLLTGRRKAARVLDVTIVSLAIGIWLVVGFDPQLGALRQLDPFSALITTAYPVGDLVLLGCTVHMLMGRSSGNRSLHLLGAALLLILGSDSFWLYDTLNGTYHVGSWVDAGWMGAYGLIGAAALHPDHRSVHRSDPNVPAHRRAALLAVAVVSGPTALVVHAARSSGLAVLLALVAIVLAVLAGLRMALLVTHLGRAARYDVLTGTLSRAGMADAITRHDEGYALLFCDIDDFKAVNDTYGHDAGDLVLQVVAERIGRGLRAQDWIARFGGDEFLVVCPGVVDPAHAQAVAARVGQGLIGAIDLDRHRSVTVSVSVGSVVVAPGETFEQALRSADAEMYRSKQASRRTAPVPLPVPAL
jgi:two-component system cell cycle response regulator